MRHAVGNSIGILRLPSVACAPSGSLRKTGVESDLDAALKSRSSTREPNRLDTRRFAGCLFFLCRGGARRKPGRVSARRACTMAGSRVSAAEPIPLTRANPAEVLKRANSLAGACSGDAMWRGVRDGILEKGTVWIEPIGCEIL
jgi:hypothetical protein